jgi:bifunctional non-homologous end joining protein LigD
MPDLLVFDLDPLRDALEADGLTPLAKTSGAKGMQFYAAISTERLTRRRLMRRAWRSGSRGRPRRR